MYNILNNIKDFLTNYGNNIVKKDDWQEYKLSDILEIEGIGKEIIKNTKQGNIPLISSCENNNGVSTKIDKGNKLFSDNRLTLAKNGSVGSIFYQENSFFATSDVMILYNKNLNKNIALFLKVVIEKVSKKFDWSNKINNENFSKMIISLPTKDNQPDWEFMNNFIEELRNKIFKNL